jgi:hypothetical protein
MARKTTEKRGKKWTWGDEGTSYRRLFKNAWMQGARRLLREKGDIVLFPGGKEVLCPLFPFRRSDGSRAQHSRCVFFNSLRVSEGV